MDVAAFQALNRFGLGPGAPPAYPKAWLRVQLSQPDSGPTPAPSTVLALEALKYDRENKPPPGQGQSRPMYRADALALLSTALTTETPFRERLVWFWTNHFTVSTRQGGCAGRSDSSRPKD